MLVPEERGKPESPERNLSEPRMRTKNKLNPYMTPSLGIEPGQHWWEASALTTAPSQLSPKIKYKQANHLRCLQYRNLVNRHGSNYDSQKIKLSKNIERIPIECRKTKTKVITLANRNRCKQHKEPISQACGEGTIGFGFGLDSHWLRKWREFC